MLKNQILIIISLIILSGCTEIHPHQDKIDLVSKEILMSDACAVESDGICIKYKEIKMDYWEVESYGKGYKITARSYDESRPSGMKIGRPIWYIEDNKIYWVNGVADRISSIMIKEAPEEIQDAILLENAK